MPWPALIENIRTALTVIKSQALNAEGRNFTSNVARKQGNQSKFDHPKPVAQLEGTQRSRPTRLPIANSIKDLLRQSLPPELLQDSEDALEEMITVASIFQLRPNVGKADVSSLRLPKSKSAATASLNRIPSLSPSPDAAAGHDLRTDSESAAVTSDKPVKQRIPAGSPAEAPSWRDRPRDSGSTSGSVAGRVARMSPSRQFKSEHPEAIAADVSFFKRQATALGQTSSGERRTRTLRFRDVRERDPPEDTPSDVPRDGSHGEPRGAASEDWKSRMRDLNKDVASELSNDDKGLVHGVSRCSLQAVDVSPYVLLY